MGCRPVAVVVMYVHKYEIRISEIWATVSNSSTHN